MDDTTLMARQNASQLALFEHGIGSAGEVLHPARGVIATVVASLPERSLPNSVVYADAAVLDDRVLDKLQAAYATAGVRAWTVWVRPGDEALARRLAARGHVRDAQPALMAGVLDEMRLAPRRALAWVPEPGWELVGRLNDRAYGLPGELELLGAAIADPLTRLWVARWDGVPAACAGVRVRDGDAEVWLVAVVPEARGHGLSRELLCHALSAARDEDGAITTALEATAMGEPTYRRLGYRPLGHFGMWEHRTG